MGMQTFVTAQSATNVPMWPSALVAITLIAFLMVMMLMAMHQGGVEGGIKMWAALGTVAGLLTGTAGTYFFTREAVRTAQDQSASAQMLADSASEQLVSATELAKNANTQVSVKTAMINEQIATIQILHADLMAKESKLQKLSRENPELGLRDEDIRIRPDVLERFRRFEDFTDGPR